MRSTGTTIIASNSLSYFFPFLGKNPTKAIYGRIFFHSEHEETFHPCVYVIEAGTITGYLLYGNKQETERDKC